MLAAEKRLVLIHSIADKSVAIQMARWLRRCDFEVWRWVAGPKPAEIDETISVSAVLVLLSKKSVGYGGSILKGIQNLVALSRRTFSGVGRIIVLRLDPDLAYSKIENSIELGIERGRPEEGVSDLLRLLRAEGAFSRLSSSPKEINLFIIKNGQAPYADRIAEGLLEHARKLLTPYGYEVKGHIRLGIAEKSSIRRQAHEFSELLWGLDRNAMNFLVPIGTEVSWYAFERFAGQLPIIFLGVRDPVDTGLISHFGSDASRGQIAGVAYGPTIERRMRLLNRALPDYRIGFVYNPLFSQDERAAEQVSEIALRVFGSVDSFPTIRVDKPSIPESKLVGVGLLFGCYYLHRQLEAFLRSTDLPIVGLDPDDVREGAVMSFGNDRQVGIIAAHEILARVVLDGVALHDLPIPMQERAYVCLNPEAVRRYQLPIDEEALSDFSDEIKWIQEVDNVWVELPWESVPGRNSPPDRDLHR